MNFESITDRPSCHLDQASAETDRTTALAIAAIRSNCSPTAQSLPECDQCGCDIPKARQEAVKGCQQCFACAEFAEAKARGYRRV
jgi:RNA polymerase-binding transcription factor DksA